MKLVINNINDISLSNISIHRDKIFYWIDDIKLNGLFFAYQKDMVLNGTRYVINFGQCEKIKQINEYFKQYHRSFLKENGPPYIEVIKNNATETVFNDMEDKIIINFKSINDNNYPRIHILPWILPN